MAECYSCGISSDRAILYEGIGNEGVVFVCRKCYFKNKIPLMGRTNVSLESIPGESVHARLSKMAGLEPVEERRRRELRPNLQDVTLRDIVEKNFQKKASLEKGKNADDLIENFHWVVMRKRRQLKFSQKELAEKVYEPLSAIEYLEKGVLPIDYLQLIKKVEQVLGIKLMKEVRKIFDPSVLSAEAKIASDLTLGDLKKVHEKKGLLRFFRKKHKEEELLKKELDEFSEKIGEEIVSEQKKIDPEVEKLVERAFMDAEVVKQKEEIKPSYAKKTDLTQKEIDDILFGRRK
jgi:ribosome-binding protein aMBF1 (putative translation factor)